MPLSLTASRSRLSLPSSASEDSTHSGADSAAECGACLLSSELLRGQKAVAIEHNGATYRLQATRLGKLILTK